MNADPDTAERSSFVVGTIGVDTFRHFFEQSLEMLCIIGSDGHLLHVNLSFVSALGYCADDVLGRSGRELVHPDDRAATAAESANLWAGADMVLYENRWRCSDGSYRWLSWTVKPDVGRGLAYCSARDVTERREHDVVADKLLAELERSNTDLAQFAYVASHDLSEPLRMVSSYVQLIADRYADQLDADADEFIAFAVDGATRMKVLIDGLLTYSRAGGPRVPPRNVDCVALVAAAVADLEAVIAEAGAMIVVDELPTVVANPAQLGQVFQNLLTNALKFVDAGVQPIVRVSAERRPGMWQFMVEDNGIGISEKHRQRIFLMFKRLHGRSEYSGTGIGLALCQKIVERGGGRIWVEGRPGGGSVFLFTVPDPSPAGVG